MSLQKINTRNIVLILMILAAIAMRFVSHEYKFLSNFTPVGAVAIFGGVYFTDKWKAYAVVILSFFFSDLMINHANTNQWDFFSSYTLWYCVCFSLTVFIGTLIKKLNTISMFLIVLAPVLIHWLIMDLPWMTQYPATIIGYGESLMAAIPFEKNMLLGDIVFGVLLFGGFELAQNKYTILRSKKRLAV